MAKVKKKVAAPTVEKKPWPKCSIKGCKKDSVMFRRLMKDDDRIHTCSNPLHIEEFNRIGAEFILANQPSEKSRLLVKGEKVATKHPKVVKGKKKATSKESEWSESDVHDDEKLGKIADESASEFVKKVKATKKVRVKK